MEKKAWISFADWLQQACDSKEWLGKPGYDMLFKCHKYTNPSRRFLDLPRELRDKIYTYALGGEIYPLSTVPSRSLLDSEARQNARLTFGKGYNPSMFKENSMIAARKSAAEV